MQQSPYPFEPFLAMTPYEAGKLFAAMADHMPHHSGGAASTRRAGSPLPPERHAVDMHMVARMGPFGLWEQVDQNRLSPQSRAFIQQCNDACSRYAERVGEALQWWKTSIGDDAIAQTRDVNGAFRARYPNLGWKTSVNPDEIGFSAVLKWYSGQGFDLISTYADYPRLKQAAREVPAHLQTEIYILEDQLSELADMLNNGTCPLLDEPVIPFMFPADNPLTLPNDGRMLMALYCLHQTSFGLNDSRHHHPVLIPSLKQYSYEGAESVKRLETLDQTVSGMAREEDFRAMLNPAMTDVDGPAIANGFAGHKERALQKFKSLPHATEEGIHLQDIFAPKIGGHGHIGQWMDWLLLGKALDETTDLPDFLKPLHAYMESVRVPEGTERGNA